MDHQADYLPLARKISRFDKICSFESILLWKFYYFTRTRLFIGKARNCQIINNTQTSWVYKWDEAERQKLLVEVFHHVSKLPLIRQTHAKLNDFSLLWLCCTLSKSEYLVRLRKLYKNSPLCVDWTLKGAQNDSSNEITWILCILFGT